MVDVICYLCKPENLLCPSKALKALVSVVLPKVDGLVVQLESSSRYFYLLPFAFLQYFIMIKINNFN